MGVEIYDTTLRDGTQSPDVNLTVSDKLELVKAMDELGIDYIELGWPGSNPKDMESFLKVNELELKHSKISAFGSTKRINLEAEDDPNLQAIIKSKAKVACIFGKSWDDHVIKQLRCTLEENLQSIRKSIEFLKSQELQVFFDAEHFFDGFKANSEYALNTLIAAFEGGAERIILCDTNGGSTVRETEDIIKEVQEFFKQENISVGLGVHMHNDSGLAVANSVNGIDLGIIHVQGTLNGFGERCGNADLCQIIPIIMEKKKRKTNIILKNLKKISELAYTLSNNKPINNQPFVGNNAFAHKGGIHVDAISKGASYEHIIPELVGNKRSIILSDLSGKANVIEMLKKFGLNDINKNDPLIIDILKKIKNMEEKGYDVGDINAEKYLIYREFFERMEPLTIISWEIKTSYEGNHEKSKCKILGKVHDEEKRVNVKIYGGPVEAAYNALKKFINSNHKNIINVKLLNYKVRLVEEREESSSVRVYIKFADDKGHEWANVGVNQNILQASFEAIEKGFRYYILKNK